MSVAASAIPWAPDWVCGAEAPDWAQSGTTDAALPFGADDLIDSEEIGIFGTEDSPYPFALPVNAIGAARAAGAPSNQVRQAEELAARGLGTKAKRQAMCGVYGRRCDCSNTACRFRGYRPFRCKNRYCSGECGRLAYNALFKKYLGLLPVAEKLVAGNRVAGNRARVIAKLDFTTINLGRMPTRDEVRAFNACIKLFLRALERAMRFKRSEYGVLYCDEFGGENTNLHAHGIYVGPVIPRQWFGKGKKLSEMWKAACRRTVFEGSFLISAKEAGGFERGLGHALKYAGKFLSKDPCRLADLELAFHGVRRVHALSAFYNALPESEPGDERDGPSCPQCGSALTEGSSFIAVCVLRREGRCELGEARRAMGRGKVFGKSADG
jgi:hypothetical protein